MEKMDKQSDDNDDCFEAYMKTVLPDVVNVASRPRFGDYSQVRIPQLE